MAGKAWEGTQLLPENRTTNDIVRSSKLDGTGGNGFYIDAVNIALRDIQRTLNQAQALLASSGSAITAGQGYIIDNGGVAQLPTGISLMRVIGINLPAGAKGFSANAQAYVTAISSWVPCTYDVGTNKINVEYVLWAAYMTEVSGDPPTVEHLVTNISGETPTFAANGSGDFSIIFTGGQLLSQYNTVSFSTGNWDGSNFFNILGQYLDVNTFQLITIKNGTPTNDSMNKTYIEIKITIHNI